jgi:hypothetical protein
MPTPVLVRSIIGADNDYSQFNAKPLHPYTLIVLDQCIKTCIVHGMIVLLAFGKGLSQKVMDIDCEHNNRLRVSILFVCHGDILSTI